MIETLNCVYIETVLTVLNKLQDSFRNVWTRHAIQDTYTYVMFLAFVFLRAISLWLICYHKTFHLKGIEWNKYKCNIYLRLI